MLLPLPGRRFIGRADVQPTSDEAEILETVVRRAAGPVHLVGHSFGGLAALAVALRKKVPLLSLVIIEAPGPGLLRSRGEHRHYGAFREMADTYLEAFQSGKGAAIASVIDFYGGRGSFDSWPQRVRDYAVEMTPVNMLDWTAAYGFQPAPASRGEHYGAHPRSAGCEKSPRGDVCERAPGAVHGKCLARDDHGSLPFHDFDPPKGGGPGHRPTRGPRSKYVEFAALEPIDP